VPLSKNPPLSVHGEADATPAPANISDIVDMTVAADSAIILRMELPFHLRLRMILPLMATATATRR
jgi:hypothetical protein